MDHEPLFKINFCKCHQFDVKENLHSRHKFERIKDSQKLIKNKQSIINKGY